MIAKICRYLIKEKILNEEEINNMTLEEVFDSFRKTIIKKEKEHETK